MRIVGQQNRSHIELDPTRAYHRGRALDALLRNALPPIKRGVTRATHAMFNQIDAERMRAAAKRING